MSKKSLVRGAAVLAAAGIIVKLLGAVFRIPLANLIGTVGMANYSPAYNLYSFLLVFATTGLPVAISKMVSERYAVGQFREAERVFRISRTLMTAIGAVGFCVLTFLAKPIAELVNMPGSAMSMQATAPALLLVPLMASYRGYFQGMQEMKPTAVSQITEQVFRVVFGLLTAKLLMDGAFMAAEYTAEQRGAAGGCFGASAGAVGGLLTMLIIYMISRRGIKARVRKDRGSAKESGRSILKKIAVIAIPITVGACIMPIVNLVDAGVVPSRLAASGFERSVVEDLYGQLTGLAAPIVAFPQVLIQAIVLSLVPMVSAANRLRDRVALHKNISLGIRMAMILALPCGLGLFVLSEPVLLLLYPTQQASVASAAVCLEALSIAFIFLAAITVMTGALQGIGRQIIPVRNLFFGVLLKVVMTWVLTAIPEINVVGASIGTICAYVLAAALDFLALRKYTGIRVSVSLTVVKPLVSALVMAVIVFFAYKGILAILGSNGTATLLSIGIGAVVYGLMILRTKTIERDELMSMPMGTRLTAICDKLKLW